MRYDSLERLLWMIEDEWLMVKCSGKRLDRKEVTRSRVSWHAASLPGRH